MFNPTDIMLEAKCGGLNFICCLKLPELLLLRDILDGTTYAEAERLYKIVCKCTVPLPPGPPTPPIPGPGPDCKRTLRSTICTGWGKGVLEAAQLALTAATGLARINQKLRVILMGLSAGLIAAQAWCSGSDEAGDATISGLCKLKTEFEKWQLGGAAIALLAPLLDIISGEIGRQLTACCSLVPVSNQPEADWAKGPFAGPDAGETDGLGEVV